jgi:hypothetical protein
MDGRGAWRDNVFIERFWRTIKYDEIYVNAYDSVAAARQGIERFVQWYNHGRPHSSVDKVPPIEAYYALLPALKTAACVVRDELPTAGNPLKTWIQLFKQSGPILSLEQVRPRPRLICIF